MTDPILKIDGVSKRFTRKPGLVVRGLDRLAGATPLRPFTRSMTSP